MNRVFSTKGSAGSAAEPDGPPRPMTREALNDFDCTPSAPCCACAGGVGL